MRRKLQATDILDALKALQAENLEGASSSEIHARVGGSYATVGRLLDKLVQENALVRKGKARATRYLPAVVAEHLTEALHATDRVIAGLFQRQILWLTLRGALTGFVGAAATLAILALMLGSLGGLALVQPVSWGMIAGVTALVPCAALALAYVTARLSVMRLLRRML